MMEQQQLIMTSQQKLFLIDHLIQKITPKYPLEVVRSQQPIAFEEQKFRNSNIQYNYQLEGDKYLRKTQTSNLRMKIQESYKIDNNSNENVQDADIYRYFKNDMICFRCHKSGHFNYTCTEILYCLYCTSSEHSTDRCKQKNVCYRCYRQGHINNQCQEEEGPFCFRCKRKHHNQCCFIMKGIQPIKHFFSTDNLQHNSNIRCMVCLQFGHPYCDKLKVKNEKQQIKNKQQIEPTMNIRKQNLNRDPRLAKTIQI